MSVGVYGGDPGGFGPGLIVLGLAPQAAKLQTATLDFAATQAAAEDFPATETLTRDFVGG